MRNEENIDILTAVFASTLQNKCLKLGAWNRDH